MGCIWAGLSEWRCNHGVERPGHWPSFLHLQLRKPNWRMESQKWTVSGLKLYSHKSLKRKGMMWMESIWMLILFYLLNMLCIVILLLVKDLSNSYLNVYLAFCVWIASTSIYYLHISFTSRSIVLTCPFSVIVSLCLSDIGTRLSVSNQQDTVLSFTVSPTWTDMRSFTPTWKTLGAVIRNLTHKFFFFLTHVKRIVHSK